MAYTARQLITQAWYLSGIVSRSFQTVSGEQINDGLFLLNSLLAIKSADTDKIPYWTIYDFTLTYNVETYTIPNLLMMESFTFFIDSVRYPTTGTTRKEYFATGRANDIQSLPFQWHFERGFGGGKLRLYFKPASNYPAQLLGKFGLTNVTLDTDLSLTYDGFYLEYLRFALAEYQCLNYSYTFPAPAKAKMKEIEKQLTNVSPPDMTSNKVSLINNRNSINYAQVNVGKGFTPS